MKQFTIQLHIEVPDDLWDHSHDDDLYAQVGYGIITAMTACMAPDTGLGDSTTDTAEHHMQEALAATGTHFSIEHATPENLALYYGPGNEWLPKNWHPTKNKFIVHQGMPPEWGEGSAAPLYHTAEHGVDAWL
jgi:hypothetical protein